MAPDCAGCCCLCYVERQGQPWCVALASDSWGSYLASREVARAYMCTCCKPRVAAWAGRSHASQLAAALLRPAAPLQV